MNGKLFRVYKWKAFTHKERRTQAKLLEEMSYGELMDDLNSAWRKVAGTTPARSDGGFWVHTLTNVFESLEALGLSIPIPKPEPKNGEENQSQRIKLR